MTFMFLSSCNHNIICDHKVDFSILTRNTKVTSCGMYWSLYFSQTVTPEIPSWKVYRWVRGGFLQYSPNFVCEFPNISLKYFCSYFIFLCSHFLSACNALLIPILCIHFVVRLWIHVHILLVDTGVLRDI